MDYGVLTKKQARLDSFRPLSPALVRNLEEWFAVELTYTSNALEGNTLTRKETALVVEKGITVGGKTLIEHLEATNHFAALGIVRELVERKEVPIRESEVLKLHEAILRGIDTPNAGAYRDVPVRISGSEVFLPNWRKVPDLMEQFGIWLSEEHVAHPVEVAAEAHYQLVTIHPFTDGNSRAARLLMNLLLMRHGYPPAIIRTEDRLAYISSLEQGQTGGSKEDFHKIVAASVDRSLDIYLEAIDS